LGRLADTVTRIEPDDLSGLAQMHCWCETLVDLGKKETEAVGETVITEVTQIAHKLEELILGEAADAVAALKAITDAVKSLAGPAGAVADAPQATAQPEPSSPAEAEPEMPALTEEELNRKLNDVFAAEVGESAPTEWEALDEPEATVTEPEPAEPAPAKPVAAAPATPAPVAPAPVAAAPAPADAVPSYVAEPLILDSKEFDFLKGFVEEAREHIESIELAVLEVERAPDDSAKIDDLFRPFHTIKGMAGFLNLRDINALTHEVETLLDQGRKGKRAVTAAVIDLVLGVVDILKVQVNGVGQWVASPNSNQVPQPPVSEVIDRLRAVVSGRINLETEAAAAAPAAKPKAAPAESASGPVTAVETPAPAAPTAAPAKATATTTASTAPASAAPSPAAPSEGQPAATAAASAAKAGDQSIRIDTDKLDALIDMVGELVIAQTLVNMSDDVAANPKLSKNVTQVTKIVRDVQEMAMAMRMVQIGPTFQKMARLVRDVSRKANKKVNLTISGEDTELDKTVIQEIGDPLVHMVRNAVDHGIESSEVRLKAGKPEAGEVHLHAGHEGGNIVITISDDGKGLDPAVLIAKGIEKGLVEPNQELTEQQAYALVFAPGFSTAAQVTDISGRGVGMDVVKRNIDSLRGHVEITSQKGKGTTFIIRLPLTLAIIDGMVIRVGRERFILPTISIQQSLRPRAEAITTVQHRGEVLNVRGELIPLVQLGEMFGLTGRINPCDAMVIIAQCDGRAIGLVVEELIGQQQVVIKTLGERFEQLRGISGAAILGDGRVGLILEMLGISAAHDAHVGRTQSRRVLTNGNTGPDDTANTRGKNTNALPATEPAELTSSQTGGSK
jgi:two-component system chemotaxis sensor kinase CheA